jgi:hypothetical protein
MYAHAREQADILLPGRPGRRVLDNAGNCYLRTKGALTPAGQCKHLKLLVVAGPISPTTSKISL